MAQVLIRAVAVFRRIPVALTWLLLAGGGAALVLLPLFGLPGYELSGALALGHGLLGGVAGISAARLERRLIRSTDPRPKNAKRFDSALISTLAAAGAACVLNLTALVPPLLASVIYALVSTRCDPFSHIGFFPLLTMPSAILSATVGVFVGFATRRAWTASLLYVATLLCSLAVTVPPILFGPQVFAFNHLLGYVPGPLYDEAISVTAALGWFRLETLLLALTVVVWPALMLDMKSGSLTRPHVRPGSALLLVLLIAGIFTLEERGPQLGTRMNEAVLQEKLGGKRETEHFILHHPRGKPKEELDRLVRDLEFRHAQISAFLGGPPPGKVHVWWYRSAQEKQALVGAGGTQFAKPWRREVHVNEAAFPHPVLKHELVHAMAAPFGAGPFGVTATMGGLMANAGIIEGVAVAGEDPVDDLTLHEWAAGMKQQKLLPDVRKLLQPTGFYAAAPSRAYTAAGSFMRWLGDTHGGEKLRALYKHGDFQGVYGQPLDGLASEWEKSLDALPLEPSAVNQAFGRFRRGSLFARPCAREVARLSNEAAELMQSDPDEAVRRYQRCAELQPDEPGHALAEATALQKSGRKAEAVDVLAALAVAVKDQPGPAAEVAMARGDLAWARGKPVEAREYLSQILALDPSPAMDRTARVKLAAIDDPEVGKALWSYFKPGGDDVKLLVLREALKGGPSDVYLSYLLGRRLAQGSAPALALPYLAAALTPGTLPDSIRKETLRLQLEALFLSGDCPGVKDALGKLPSYSTAFTERAKEWDERCVFEQTAFKGPLLPDPGG
jgi:tetratricopeptide (TPR) repeat protein